MLLPESEELLLLSLQFVGKKIYDFSFFEKKLAATLKRLIANLEAKKATGADGNN
ncbi:hypothetical protein D3C85_1861890 [compost metagenome]